MCVLGGERGGYNRLASCVKRNSIMSLRWREKNTCWATHLEDMRATTRVEYVRGSSHAKLWEHIND